MRKLPKVQKAFGLVGRSDRLREQTVKTVVGAFLATGLMLGGTEATSASVATGSSTMVSAPIGGVVILLPPPAISIDDGRTKVAGHYSHSSHASHASHASHCSGYSYCG